MASLQRGSLTDVGLQIAQQRHQDRMKLLKAFGNMPQIIYMAMSKAEHFPPDETKPETTRLHQSIASLRVTLLKVLPALIERLVPGTLCKCIHSSYTSATYASCIPPQANHS